MSVIFRVTRRDFLRQAGLGAGVLVFGSCLSSSLHGGGLRDLLVNGLPVAGNPFVAFKANGDIVIITHRAEMGQGIRSSLAGVLVDEMAADWNRVILRQADADGHRFAIEQPFQAPGAFVKYLVPGELAQYTESSRSMAMYFMPMRLFGAAIRLVMIRAAAKKFGVDPKECYAEKHRVYGPSGRSVDYRWLLLSAKKIAMPTYDEILAELNVPSRWRLIGKSIPFVDAQDMVTGSTVYCADIDLPGMLTATIERCPVANGRLVAYDPEAALAVRGVRRVLPMFPSELAAGGVGRGYTPCAGVAVLADNTWAAMRGRNALKPTIVWDLGSHADYDSDAYRKELDSSTAAPGKLVRSKGDVDAAFAQASHVIEATYYVPHLAQAPMEPPVAIALFKNGRIEVWAPTQSPHVTQALVGQIALGLRDCEMDWECFERAQQAATVHMTMLGGAFGRKLYPDFIVEAAILAKQNPGVPIRVQWTREDDVKFSYYNAPSNQYLKAALDANGHPTALLQRSAFPSLIATFFPPPSAGLTPTEVERSAKYRAAAFSNSSQYPYASGFELGQGLEDMPFDVPNLRIENCPAENHIRIGCVRSGANIQHAFAICSFADELAVAAGRDSKDYLLELIGKGRILPLRSEHVDHPANNGFPLETVTLSLPGGRELPVIPGYPPDTGRLRGVVERVAKEAGWDEKVGKLPKGRGLGIAAHRSYLSYVAVVIDVSLDARGTLTINEIHGAIDCGIAVNPDRVIAQMEGGIIFGLSVALFGQITVKKGAVIESNFDDYPVLRLNQMPGKLSVHIIPSAEPPTGAGEPPTPAVAPALANAIVAAGGPRVREIPFCKTVLVGETTQVAGMERP